MSFRFTLVPTGQCRAASVHTIHTVDLNHSSGTLNRGTQILCFKQTCPTFVLKGDIIFIVRDKTENCFTFDTAKDKEVTAIKVCKKKTVKTQANA